MIIASLFALSVLGFTTFLRMLTRNQNTDRYKHGLDSVRQLFKDHFDGDNLLIGYYPIGGPKAGATDDPTKTLRKFGGLAHTVAAINSFLLGGLLTVLASSLVGPILFRGIHQMILLGLIFGLFIAAFCLTLWGQVKFARMHEARTKRELHAGDPSHAGGVVYRMTNGSAQYLLVTPKNNSNEWVLPKGHVEPEEGHGEAALREVREETGVNARLICLAGRVVFKTRGDRVDVKYYLMEMVSDAGSMEKRKVKWGSLEEALTLLSYPESKQVMREAEKRRLAEMTRG